MIEQTEDEQSVEEAVAVEQVKTTVFLTIRLLNAFLKKSCSIFEFKFKFECTFYRAKPGRF